MKLSLLILFSGLLLLFGLCARPAAAQDSRWVTFTTIRDKWGMTEHQIDRATIKQEGPYRIFWTRLWLPASKQPLAVSSNGVLYIAAQKFAVDCARRRFASRYIDSTVPRERLKAVSLQTAAWNSLDKHPVIDRAICGMK